MKRSKLFFYILLGFLSGILLHSFFIHPALLPSGQGAVVSLPALFWPMIIALCFGAVVFFWRTPYFLASILFGVACILGLYRFEMGLNKLNASFASGEITFKAAGEVRRYPNSYQFVGENEDGRFWVITKTPIAMTDTVSGDCRFESVKPSDQYYGWYASKGVNNVCFLNNATIVEHGNTLMKQLFKIKTTAIDHIKFS